MSGITRIKSKTKCDTVVDAMLAMIINGEYAQGQRLPAETVLMESFGVSRVTVREAFKKLHTMGVVLIRQGEGTFVNRIDMGTMMKPLFAMITFDKMSVNQIYDARLFIEAGTCALAAINRTDSQLAFLKELVGKMRIAVSDADSEAFSDLDAEFHLAIGEASKNDILLGAYITIKSILKGYIKKTNYARSTVRTSLDFHAGIVELLESGNAIEAEAMMRRHIESSKKSLIRQLEPKKPGGEKIERV